MNQIELEEYDDSAFGEQASETLVYPCAILQGITTVEEFTFFKEHKNNPEISIPLYCYVDGVACRVGLLELSLTRLLTLRSISEYKLEIKRSQNDSVIIDLNNPDALLKFIKLGG